MSNYGSMGSLELRGLFMCRCINDNREMRMTGPPHTFSFDARSLNLYAHMCNYSMMKIMREPNAKL
jgi:hypothetical protein